MGLLTMRRRVLLSLPLAAAAARVARAQPPPPPPLVAIVGQGSPLAALPLATLRALFLGDPVTGPDGNKLIPLNQPPGSPDRVAFDRVVLGMTPEQSARYWIDRRIRGEGRPPRSVDASLLQRLVPRLPGAVGYLRLRTPEPGVKVLRIDGKAPGDPGYPLVG